MLTKWATGAFVENNFGTYYALEETPLEQNTLYGLFPLGKWPLEILRSSCATDSEMLALKRRIKLHTFNALMSKSFYFDAPCHGIIEEVAELAVSVSNALMQWCDLFLQLSASHSHLIRRVMTFKYVLLEVNRNNCWPGGVMWAGVGWLCHWRQWIALYVS